MQLNVDDNVSFTVYSAVNGATSFKGVVEGMLSGKIHPFKDEAAAIHSTIYPLLPEALRVIYEDDYRTYNYYAIARDDGSVVYIGEPWINESTITYISEKQRKIIVTGFTGTDADLRLILEQNRVTVKSVGDVD